MSVEGVWDLTIATPVGRIKPVVELSREGDEFTGVAHGVGEEVPSVTSSSTATGSPGSRRSPSRCAST